MSLPDPISQSDDSNQCHQRSCGRKEPEHPRSFVRGSGQYLYSPTNKQYLDCIGSVAHVGHSHPRISSALIGQMANKICLFNGATEADDLQYPKALLKKLPDCYDSVLFCNSGSEAVDLAIQLSNLFTKGRQVICMEGSFHGSSESVCHMSSKLPLKLKIENWVEVLSAPKSSSGMSFQQVLCKLKDIIRNSKINGNQISAFICEPYLVMLGCMKPPAIWLQEVYRLVRETKGLCIADEVQTGFGRIGSHYWSFELLEVKPDIVIIGKSAGNGYPMAAVVTRKEISCLLGERLKNYTCTPVMNAVGLMLMQIISDEQLIENCLQVSNIFIERLKDLMSMHKSINDVRGSGFMIGIEIVCCITRQPSKAIAQEIMSRMRQENILIASEGLHGNVLLVMPPLCFCVRDAISFAEKLQKIVIEIEAKFLSKNSQKQREKLLTAREDISISECCVGIMQDSPKLLEYCSPYSAPINHAYFDPD